MNASAALQELRSPRTIRACGLRGATAHFETEMLATVKGRGLEE